MTDNLHLAFVLHTRLYRDNSLLVELFTRDKGKVSAIAKGARQPKSSFKNALQLFQPVLVSWVGKKDLVTLTHAEVIDYIPLLGGERCWCGLYLNELLMYLIDRQDPYPLLFDKYQQTIALLNHSTVMELPLRYFEKYLLTEIGYGIDLILDNHRQVIKEQNLYHYIPDQGMVMLNNIEEQIEISEKSIFQGKNLLALHHETIDDDTGIKEAKRLLRQALAPLLGNKPLKSRELFI